MKLYQTFFLILFLLVFSSLKAQTATIMTESYDAAKNETALVLIPQGSVTIPGKWKKIKYNEVAKQHFFKDDAGTTLSIAKNPQESYPFYKKRKSDKEFVEDFVKWETDFYKQNGHESTILENQSDKGFIIWQIKSEKVNTVLFYGAKNGYAYTFSIGSGPLTDAERVSFLSKLYNEN